MHPLPLFFLLVATQGLCTMILSLAPGKSDLRRTWFVSFIYGSASMTLGMWQHVPALIILLKTPRDEFSNDLSLHDVQARPPAFWHAAWLAHYALRCITYCGVGLAFIVCVRQSTRVLLRALCVTLGLKMLLQGMTDVLLMALALSAGRARALWFWPLVSLQALLVMAFGIWLLAPASRITAQVLFARLGSRGLQSKPRTAIAGIIGYGSSTIEREPPSLVAAALQLFRPVELTVEALRGMGATLFASSDNLLRARAHWHVDRWRQTPQEEGTWFLSSNKDSRVDKNRVKPSPELLAADCYVVHSPADNAGDKLEALIAWVGWFETEHGRPPRVWLSSLCVDPSLSRLELLEHMPVYLARSKQLLLLAGSHGVTHLWGAMECYVFRALGGHVDDIDVSIVGAPPVPRSLDDGNAARVYAGSVVSAFDTFHAMLTSADEEIEVRSRLQYAIELVTVNNFNIVVREIMPRARASAAERPARQHSTAM